MAKRASYPNFVRMNVKSSPSGLVVAFRFAPKPGGLHFPYLRAQLGGKRKSQARYPALYSEARRASLYNHPSKARTAVQQRTRLHANVLSL